jgi:hypothetical protein
MNNPREIFGLALRLLGLWLFYLGVNMLPMAVVTGWMLLQVGVLFGLGWWLVGGARLLMDRAYPATPTVSAPASEAGVPSIMRPEQG